MPDLFGAKGAYSVEPESKNQAVFLSNSNVEGVVLYRDSAAIPAVAQGHGRADEGFISLPRATLKIEEERGAAEESLFAVTQKD